jgi:nitrous oxidase accessory protein NosD
MTFKTAVLFALTLLAVGSTSQAQCLGDRFVAADGDDFGNNCALSATPCQTITYAAAVACDHETIQVAEGEYLQDVVITHPVRVHGNGSIILTHLQGTGTADVVKILSSDVSWGGVTVWRTHGVPLMRIGDATHPNLRNVTLDNATFREGDTGVVVESTGSDPSFGFNRFLGVIVRNMDGDGIVLQGGNGRLQIAAGRLHHIAGTALKVEAPPPGATNRQIVVSGEWIFTNGAGGEFHRVSDLQLEGNEWYEHATSLKLVDSDNVIATCNRFHDSQTAVEIGGSSHHVTLAYNTLYAHTLRGAQIGNGVGDAIALQRSTFSGNAVAIEHLDTELLDARFNWFAPSESVQGLVDTSATVVSVNPPHLVRRPENSGWEFPIAACHQRVSDAAALALPNDTMLIGSGEYYEHVVLDKPLTLLGEANSGGCSASILRGDQSGPTRPALTLDGVSQARLQNLTIRSAAQGLPCGSTDSEQVGLSLNNVQDSTFEQLCLRDNGHTDLRLSGASHRNQFRALEIDGMTVDMFGRDLCGHRSRNAISVESTAPADRNRFEAITAQHVTRGLSLAGASNTLLTGSVISVEPAPAWNAPDAGLFVQAPSAALTVRCNRFSDSPLAAWIDDIGPDGATLSLIGNDFDANVQDASYAGALTLSARDNYWGSASGPSLGDITGPVLAAPFLEATALGDPDSDGVSWCAGDCGVTNAAIHPGATELCDGLDNDCNTLSDDLPAPAGRPDLRVDRYVGGARLHWQPVTNAASYDIVDGGLGALLAGEGHFELCTDSCLASALAATDLIDSATPEAAGTAVWYLVRARNCNQVGTYDDVGGLVASRDAGIESAPSHCP